MFKAECKYSHKDLYLSITHNGYQWTSIAIKNPEHEIPLIIKALEYHLSDKPSGMICWYCNQPYWDGKGQIRCKFDGKVISGPIYYSKRPCNCPIEKEPKGNNLLEEMAKDNL